MTVHPQPGTDAYVRLLDKNLYHGDRVSTLCTCTGDHPADDGRYTGWSKTSLGRT